MHKFKELLVWQRAVDFTVEVYNKTLQFPNYEIYGLTSQIRRSAVSIPSNIAEGAGRKSIAEFSRFVDIAYGSSCEYETQLLIANKLQYLSSSDSDYLINEVNEIQKCYMDSKNNSNEQYTEC